MNTQKSSFRNGVMLMVGLWCLLAAPLAVAYFALDRAPATTEHANAH